MSKNNFFKAKQNASKILYIYLYKKLWKKINKAIKKKKSEKLKLKNN